MNSPYHSENMQLKRPHHTENAPQRHPFMNQQPQRSFLWIGLIFFVSGWIFLLGVLVGRRSAPALFDYYKIETEISELAKSFAASKEAKIKGEKDSLTAQEGLAFFDELKNKTGNDFEMQLPMPEKQPGIPEKLAVVPDKPVRQTEIAKTVSSDFIQPKPVQTSLSPSRTDGKSVDAKPEKDEGAPDGIISEHSETIVNPVHETRLPKPKEPSPVKPIQPRLAQTGLSPSKINGKPVNTRLEMDEEAPDDIISEHSGTKVKSVYETRLPKPKEPAPAQEHRETASKTALPEPRDSAQQKTVSSVSENKPDNKVDKSESGHQVKLQLTSLIDRRSADAMIATLQKKGISASKVAKMVPGQGIWYRVVVGKYSSAEAEAISSILKQDNIDVSVEKP